jgi:membrane carboxypeptidase/penicillin-binding protein PbpC
MMPCDLHSIKDEKRVTTLPPELDFMTLESSEKKVMQRAGIEIVSPVSGGRYIISSASSEKQKIPFRAEGGHERLYWFGDGVFAGESSTVLPLFCALTPGDHNVSVMDSLGRSAATSVEIVTIENQREKILELR